MAEHDWSSKGFVHGAPGAMDCWDQRVRCVKCGVHAVLMNQVPTYALTEKSYNSHVGKTTGDGRVKGLERCTRLPNDCEQMVVDEVHSL